MQLYFPKLASALSDGNFKSPSTPKYNCIGFAVGQLKWFDPNRGDGEEWPDDLDSSVESFLEFFQRSGFIPCDDLTFEDGFEKLAIFVDDGEFCHVAIQTTAGDWISKLGDLEDIGHPIEKMENHAYGTILHRLKRKGSFNRDIFPKFPI
jgi:hypothetical protein